MSEQGLTWSSIAKLAHDLREPLAAIMMWEQVMRASDDATVRARALEAIRDAAAAQALIIDRIQALGASSA